MGTTLKFRSYGSSPNNRRQANTSLCACCPTIQDKSCNLLFIFLNLVSSFTIKPRVALSSSRSCNLVVITFILSFILLHYNECFENKLSYLAGAGF
ncbi:hypothetical protein HanRHA438_Chr13g0620351 [Helianthus annuus]|nr:hypothetical protein HanRHA438_Chr13g0620351 [Helianthus annuus]